MCFKGLFRNFSGIIMTGIVDNSTTLAATLPIKMRFIPLAPVLPKMIISTLCFLAVPKIISTVPTPGIISVEIAVLFILLALVFIALFTNLSNSVFKNPI